MADESQTTLSTEEARFVEGYARALFDLSYELTGEPSGIKTYDPMTIEEREGKMHSYVFDMKDGGRHHPISDYKDKDEICKTLLEEAITWMPKPRK